MRRWTLYRKIFFTIEKLHEVGEMDLALKIFKNIYSLNRFKQILVGIGGNSTYTLETLPFYTQICKSKNVFGYTKFSLQKNCVAKNRHLKFQKNKIIPFSASNEQSPRILNFIWYKYIFLYQADIFFIAFN